jgi:hypothetical protein
MQNKIRNLSLFTGFIIASVATATNINFSAQIANNLSGVSGADLAPGDRVEVGIWTGSAFNFISDGTNDNIGLAPGFFSHSSGLFDSTSNVGSQLAFRWSEAASGFSAILYYDISTGLDSGRVDQWTLKSGDGGGNDFNENSIDIADLADSSTSWTTLDSAAVLLGATFTGNNVVDVPSFQVSAVPEPSTYAAIAGLVVLGFTAVRRRRRA